MIVHSLDTQKYAVKMPVDMNMPLEYVNILLHEKITFRRRYPHSKLN